MCIIFQIPSWMKAIIKLMGKKYFYNLSRNILLENNLLKFKNRLKENLIGFALNSTIREP